jgi:DNA replication initiation complex subunit (GINS family)
MGEAKNKKDRSAPRLKYLEDQFYCRARRRRLSLRKCLSDYCSANAFENKKSACWRCPQGKVNRCEYAAELF